MIKKIGFKSSVLYLLTLRTHRWITAAISNAKLADAVRTTASSRNKLGTRTAVTFSRPSVCKSCRAGGRPEKALHTSLGNASAIDSSSFLKGDKKTRAAFPLYMIHIELLDSRETADESSLRECTENLDVHLPTPSTLSSHRLRLCCIFPTAPHVAPCGSLIYSSWISARHSITNQERCR